ncbi:MAG: hypothetical protein J6Q58_02845, partial [Clostridia bacterium]|nr:hypothetical protein [Clostridia bacterium]
MDGWYNYTHPTLSTITPSEGTTSSTIPADAIEIGTLAQLQNLRDGVNAGTLNTTGKYYVLTADIDMSSVFNWTPIGINTTNYFKGTFDGNYHTISGLTISSTSYTSTNYAGLFGYIKTGSSVTIRNLCLSNVNISIKGNLNTYCVGAFVGDAIGANIYSCMASGSISATSTYDASSGKNTTVNAGGLAGMVGGVYGSYNACTVFAETTQSDDEYITTVRAGGIVAQLPVNTSIQYCFNIGDISAETTSYSRGEIGGIVGRVNGGDILGCYNLGAVNLTMTTYCTGSYAGGIVGWNNSMNNVISTCYNEGNVVADVQGRSTATNAGGIVAYTKSSIDNCYNTGNVMADKGLTNSTNIVAYAGGIAGYLYFNNIDKCYNTGLVAALTYASTSTSYIGGIIGRFDNSTAHPSVDCYNAGNLAYRTSSKSTLNIGVIYGACDTDILSLDSNFLLGIVVGTLTGLTNTTLANTAEPTLAQQQEAGYIDGLSWLTSGFLDYETENDYWAETTDSHPALKMPVSTVAGLYGLQFSNEDKYYYLTNSIDVSSKNGFRIAGDSTTPWSGTLDGNGYVINGLTRQGTIA